MTTIEEFEARLAVLLDEVRTVRAAPRAAVNPDGTPGNVAAGELIESAWGNAVADTFPWALTRNMISGSDVTGRLLVQGGVETRTTDGSGDIRILFPYSGVGERFIAAPVVFAHLLANDNSVVIHPWGITTLESWFRFRRTTDATNYTAAGVTFNWLAIGQGPVP